MMQFPMALSRCGVSGDLQNMLMEAIKSLNYLKVQVRVPQEQLPLNNSEKMTEEITGQMAKAVEDWTAFNFEAFGYELGKLFRELIMLAFPQKYSFDASGRLQKYTQMKLAGEDKTAASTS